jgi:tetratricopeptide (TPR) repeat protein
LVIFFSFLCAFGLLFLCHSPLENNGLPGLDDAIQASAEQLGIDLAGRKVAVVAFGSGAEALSDYVIDELARALVNSRTVTVVDRKDLDKVRAELQFNLSGEVSDESAQSIGKMLGAQSVITGTLTDLGSAYRFGVKAINVESAALESTPGFDVGKRDGRIAHLAGQKGAAMLAPAVQPPVPGTVRDFLDRGILFAIRGDYELAIADFTEALRLDPKLGEA